MIGKKRLLYILVSYEYKQPFVVDGTGLAVHMG